MAIYFGQDADTKLALADAYYDERSVYKYDWNKLSDAEKKLGLLHSEDRINMHLGLDLEENYSSQSFPLGDNPNFRPDYAIFVDALFLLENSARTAESTEGVRRIESEDYQREERQSGVPIAPEALRYLRINRLQITRA